MGAIRCRMTAALGGLLVVSLLGCSTLPILAELTPKPEPTKQEVAEHRQKFLIDGDPDAFRWLTANQLENGMTVDEVGAVYGDPGEMLEQDGQYKNKGGLYQTTDQGYRWGPDREGKSITLFFREGRLIYFDPKEQW